MSQPASVTAWIEQVKAGDQQAAQLIWERFCVSLAGLARHKLAGSKRREVDEYDVVQEAFLAFFRAMQSGRPPQLADRDDLWRLLVTITDNKARDQVKQQRRQKRGAGQTRGDSVFQDLDSVRGGIDQNPGAEPTPEFTAQAIEECRRLLGLLGDSQLERIVLLKMEGFTREEIAQQLDCVPETIGRKLRLIRTTWSQGADL